jgi:hypothetical protein
VVGGGGGAVILISLPQEDNEAVAISAITRLRIRVARIEIDLSMRFSRF